MANTINSTIKGKAYEYACIIALSEILKGVRSFEAVDNESLIIARGRYIVRGEGAAKISMIGGIIGTVVNIILDPLLILTFHMNTAGAAIATVAGNLVGCAFYLIYFWSKKSNLSLHPKHLKYWKANIKEVLSLGLPAGANAALSGVAMLLLIKVLASYGDNTVAAMGIVTKANMLIEFVQRHSKRNTCIAWLQLRHWEYAPFQKDFAV